jgi:hypothetical protein
VPNARNRPANLDGCDIHNELLELHWLGNTAEIRLKFNSYSPAPGDQRPEEVGARVYLDSTQKLEAFRGELQDRVINGCLRSDEAQRLTRTTAESFPLPPWVSNLIRFGGGPDGFIDLTSDFRLKVTTPVRRNDATREIIGFQVAYYYIRSASKSARVKISFDSASTGESKEAPVSQSAAAQTLSFPASFRFYRLLFRTAISSSDHRTTILSAKDQAALNKATSQFEMKRDASCETLSVPHATCMNIPAGVAVNLEFSVRVQDKQVFVPLEGTLSNILPGKLKIEIPATLRIRRLFRGHLCAVKFDRASRDMRGFALMPGDAITW